MNLSPVKHSSGISNVSPMRPQLDSTLLSSVTRLPRKYAEIYIYDLDDTLVATSLRRDEIDPKLNEFP
jgi:hypothetical protein